MHANLKRVFWSNVSVVPIDGGFQVLLDERALRSPEKSDFILPTAALAEVVAAEWRAQEGEIAPTSMPFTRLCNAAIDKMPEQAAAVVEMLASYGETDLLCHRATSPAELVTRQAEGWDPVLTWAASARDIHLNVTSGVIPVDQPDASQKRITDWVDQHRGFSLMALHDMVMISGSVILALAVADGHLTAEGAWKMSRIDEDWQEEKWGFDDDAAATAAAKKDDFCRAVDLYRYVT